MRIIDRVSNLAPFLFNGTDDGKSWSGNNCDGNEDLSSAPSMFQQISCVKDHAKTSLSCVSEVNKRVQKC